MDEADSQAEAPKYEQSALIEYSPLTYWLTRLFELLRLLSPSFWVLQSRPAIQEKFKDGDARALTRGRSRRVEAYILAWFALEVALVVTVTVWPSASWRWWITALVAWRLVDIVQASMNLSVFDRLRIESGTHYIASAARIALLSLWNYSEAILCFGLLYANHHACLTRTVANTSLDVFDPFYFSATTQLTIGYGDIVPTGGLRAVAAAQGMLGFVLGVFVLSRVIAFLPRAQTIMRDD